MHTIYTKYTDYRRARFRIMTSIREDHGTRTVIKKNAPGGDAFRHLEQIERNRSLLESPYEGVLSVCPCRWSGRALEFPFIQGISYLDRLREAGAEGGLAGFLDCFHAYLPLLRGHQPLVPFAYTDDFQLFFGRVPGLEGQMCLPISNLDASPRNLIEDAAGEIHLIDYEWVFTFPIPLDFVLFRHLRLLCTEPGFDCLRGVTLGDLLRDAGVRMHPDTLYALYDSFQQYVCVENNAALSCAEIFERHRQPICEGAGGKFRCPPHFVFLDKGEGFHEQDKLVIPADDGNLDLHIDVAGAKAIRFDPFEGRRTLTERLAFTTDSGQVLVYGVPTHTPVGDRIIFNAPANAVAEIPEGTESLTISGTVTYMNARDDLWVGPTQSAVSRAAELERTLEAERTAWNAERSALKTQRDQLAQNGQELEAARSEAAQLRQQLDMMQNSRSWKATAWMRRLRALGRGSQ